MTDRTASFPDGFLWGAATSGHQVEGNNVSSDYWAWEHAPDTPFTEPSGDGVDHYHRWPEDLDLLAGTGLSAYRFSLEWSRIEPEDGEVSRAALDHYRRMIDGCRDRGLTPVVTLNHMTVPHWFATDGGWLDDRAGDRFARFAETAATIVRDAAYVVTLNEPNLMACLPTIGARIARGEVMTGLPLPDPRLSESLLGVHRRAVEVLRGAGSPPAGLSLLGQEWIAEDGGQDLLKVHRAAMEDDFLSACEGDDFIGMQIYSCARFGPDGQTPPAADLMTLANIEYRPQALGAAVGRVAGLLPRTPIVVTENGLATADDPQRIAFIDEALRGLHTAIRDGADVRGYFHWSLLDNFEWFSGYAVTFGLIGVDRGTFTRTPRASLARLGEIARRNGLVAR